MMWLGSSDPTCAVTRRKHLRLVSAAFFASALTGCGFAHDERIDGPYRLVAIDADEEMSVCYDLAAHNCVGRVSQTVFAVGWNSNYIVAARHPKSDRAKSEYFYIVRGLDGPYVDPTTCVRGPFQVAEFEVERRRLSLPSLTKQF